MCPSRGLRYMFRVLEWGFAQIWMVLRYEFSRRCRLPSTLEPPSLKPAAFKSILGALNLNSDTFRKPRALLPARNISTTMASLYVRRRSLGY